MASTLKHLRSSTADKRPTGSGLADGQLAINTASGTPGLFFKDNNGTVVKVGPVHVGTAAPNAVPAGSTGNAKGELWVDENTTTPGLKYYSGSAFVNLTPSGTTTAVGLVELATSAETQAGSDNVRAVTSFGLQSKISDSTSTTSSTTIASATAVKAAYDLANAALPKTGGTVTGEILISPSGSLVFEGSSDDSFETTLAVTNPTADRTITFPNVTGTVVTTGDTGSVTSAMILDGTILNADVNASAAIAGTKISPNFGSQTIETTGVFSHALGAAATPSVTFTGDLNTGIYSPGADQVAVATNGTGRLFIDATGNVGVGVAPANNAGVTELAVGTSATNPQFSGIRDGVNAFLLKSDTAGTTLFERRNLDLILGANNGEKLRITSAGNVGIGTSSPEARLHVFVPANGYTSLANTFGVAGPDSTGLYVGTHYDGSGGGCDLVARGYSAGLGDFRFFSVNGSYLSPVERLRITSTGNVGIGTTSPSRALHVTSSASEQVLLTSTSGSLAGIFFEPNGTTYTPFFGATGTSLVSYTSGLERCRVDGSGRLLVGTSSARGNFFNSTFSPLVQFEGANNDGARLQSFTYGRAASSDGPIFVLAKCRDNSVGGNTTVASGDQLGWLSFQGNDGTEFVEGASIRAEVDATPGANDMPGRLVFSTTADGASSPTERMRIANDGTVDYSPATAANPKQILNASNNTVAISFRSASVERGNIFFLDSGVAYNTTSDYRLKENVEPINGAVDRILHLKPSRFNFIVDRGKTVDGFIAHEVQSIVPEAITGEKDAVDEDGNPVYQGIDQSKLVPLLTAALQELVAEVESLKAEVAALKAQSPPSPVTLTQL